MSASEAEEQASGPQSVEERLGESLVPLTQLGLTDPASTNESDGSSSFNSIAYLYLPPTPRPLLPSVRERSPAASGKESDVECNEPPAASGEIPAASGEPPAATGMFICTVHPAASGEPPAATGNVTY